MVVNVEIYIWLICLFCICVKVFLNKKEVNYQEYVIDGDDIEWEKMVIRVNGCNILF